MVARATLIGQDATTPDYVEIGDYWDIAAFYPKWLPGSYTANPTVPIGDEATDPLGDQGIESYALNWDQQTLQPGATRTIVTYYGMGDATAAWTSTGTSGATQQDTGRCWRYGAEKPEV